MKNQEKMTAMETAIDYMKDIKDGRPKDENKIFALFEGLEPIVFTCHFHGWDTGNIFK